MPKEKFRKVYSQPLGLYLSLSVLPTSFALIFLTRFYSLYWEFTGFRFWLENFLQKAELESIVETSRWVVELKQDFLLEFFWFKYKIFLCVFL